MADEISKVNDTDVSSIVSEQNKKLDDALDNVYKLSPSGGMSTAIGDSFFGINHRQQPGAIPINKDMHGLTFFTRPDLNLTTENIRNARLLTPLLTTVANSLPRIIRSTLDPNLTRADANITSPFVDDRQAFIPMLTNNLLSMSGWPDIDAPTYTAKEGVYKETFGFIDGIVRNFSSFDITANFRNLSGDPINNLFYYWINYADLVHIGEIVPYTLNLINNTIDYNTRIYRIILDPTKTYVQAIAACGASFPTSCPMGAKFNFEADRPLNQSNDQISITFKCFGAIYQDPILIYEFNRVGQLFNPGMKDSTRSKYFVKIPMDALGIFRNRGYPRINTDTYELEWWVDAEEYNYQLPLLNAKRKLGEVERIK